VHLLALTTASLCFFGNYAGAAENQGTQLKDKKIKSAIVSALMLAKHFKNKD